jgi:hypothetical protein
MAIVYIDSYRNKYLLKVFYKHFFFQSFSRSAQPRKASFREIFNTTLPFLIQPMLETPLTMFQRMSWQNTDALLTLRIEDQATVSFLKSYNDIHCFFIVILGMTYFFRQFTFSKLYWDLYSLFYLDFYFFFGLLLHFLNKSRSDLGFLLSFLVSKN